MKLKVVMDSGKEYEVESSYENVEEFVDQNFYNEINMGIGGRVSTLINKITKFTFKDSEIYINPSHVSSIEIL